LLIYALGQTARTRIFFGDWRENGRCAPLTSQRTKAKA